MGKKEFFNSEIQIIKVLPFETLCVLLCVP